MLTPRELHPERRLTPRQLDVLDLVANGLSNKEIAYQLGMSEFTVQDHLKTIFRILGVSDRLAAVIAAGILRRAS